MRFDHAHRHDKQASQDTLETEDTHDKSDPHNPHNTHGTHGGEDQDSDSLDDISPGERAAMLMVALGEDAAGEVMQYLNDHEIETLTQAITELKPLSSSLQDTILEDFEQHMLAGTWVNQGGVEFARGTLQQAVGEQRAQEILDRVLANEASGFHLLRNVDPAQIAPFITHEHPQTIALILSQLDTVQAAGVLNQLPESIQAEVTYRIATLDHITPAVLKQIEESLETNLRDLIQGNRDAGGPKVVANMLNMTGSAVEKNVLDHLDTQNSAVAETVRNMMFVFEDIRHLADREIQSLLREVEQRDLIVALKAASEELKEKILANMSDRVRAYIEEEIAFLGPMRLSEVESVQLDIVQKVRQLEQQGQIHVVRGSGEETFV